MSFIITVYTNEGIVMASDSRTTYTTTENMPNGSIIKQIGSQFTDTTYKTFTCNDRIGLSTCGDATINSQPIAGYIEKFIAEKVNSSSEVEDVANNVLTYFKAFNPIPNTTFIIAGYNKTTMEQRICRVYVGEDNIIPVDTTESGAVWNGEIEFFSRLVNNIALKNQDGSYTDLNSYQTLFNYFTLQDAIEYAKFAVEVTIKAMTFQVCVKTVGGPIDILAIKPSGAFWIQHKELHA